jgi:tetratricopeptide (TPR) repeat protein
MRPQIKQTVRSSQRRKDGARATASPFAPNSLHSSAGRRIALACAALIALVAIAYANSLGNGFVWDDHQQIVMNPAVKADAPLTLLFTSDVRFAKRSQTVDSSDYRPLQMLTYRLLQSAFGADATAFHACSVVFAMGGALAAFAVFLCLTGRLGLAFVAAALFAVYPVHSEAVDWIAALPELGCTLFLLLSFWGYLVAASRYDRERRLRLALSWLAFACALLWKETAVVFPVLLSAFLLLNGKRQGRLRRVATQTAGYWLVLACYLALRYAVLGSLSAGPRDWGLNGPLSLLNMIYLLASYWAKLALPFWLNAYYAFHPIRSLTEPRGLVALGLSFTSIAALAAAVVWYRRSRVEAVVEHDGPAPTRGLVAFAAVWVVITLLPALNLAGLGRNAFTERYLYLPSVGFCLLLALAGAWLRDCLPVNQRRIACSLLLGLALAGCMAETVERNPDWKDDATLFAETLKRSPDAPFVHVMVAGFESSDPSQSAAAEVNYTQAIALARAAAPPDRLEAVAAFQGLASLYADRNQYPQALQAVAQAEEMAPDDADIHGEEGLILARAGRGRDTVPLLRSALARQPNDVNVISALALVERDDLHDAAAAEQLFEKALALHTEDDEFAASQHNNLGAVFGDQNKFAQAVAQFREAVRIQPNDPQYHLNLAIALATEDRRAEAIDEAKTAVQLAPNDSAPRQLLEDLTKPHP